MDQASRHSRAGGYGLALTVVAGCCLLLATTMVLPRDPWSLEVRCGSASIVAAQGAAVVAVAGRPFDQWLEASWPPWSALPWPGWQPGAPVQFTIAGREVRQETAVLGGPSASLNPTAILDWLARRWTYIFLSFSFLATALFAFWHRPQEKASRLLLLWSLAVFVRWFLHSRQHNFTFAEIVYAWPFWIHWLSGLIASALMVAFGIHFALVFPEEKELLHRHRIPLLATLYGVALASEFVPVIGVRPFSCAVARAYVVENLLFLVCALIGVAALFHSYRTASTPVARAQLRWIFYGAVFAFLPGVLGVSLPSLLGTAGPVPLGWGALLVSVFPMTIGVAITRYRLWDIDILINRSLVYGPVVVLLAGLYLAGVTALQFVLRNLTGGTTDVAVAVTAIVVALAFNPLRERVQATVDRYFYRERVVWAPLLRDFSHRAQQGLPLQTLSDALTAVLQRALKPSQVCLWLYHEGTGQLMRAGGNGPETLPLQPSQRGRLIERYEAMGVIRGRTDEDARPFDDMGLTVALPLVTLGEFIGLLGLWPKRSGADYNREELDFLQTLAGQAALALRSAQLYDALQRRIADLRQAYGQLVGAREEERRDLANELHDETLQQLARLALQVGQARRDLERDPARLAQRLASLQAEVEAADHRLRNIVGGLHPTVLVDLGLVPALRAHLSSLSGALSAPLTAARESCTELILRVRGFGTQRLPDPDQELAIYRFVQQALANAVQHAGAKQILIELLWMDGEVVIRVADDGRGTGGMNVEQAVRAGRFGLLSMQERFYAQGGTFEFGQRPGGGTIVEGRLPVGTFSADREREEWFTLQLSSSAPDDPLRAGPFGGLRTGSAAGS